MNDWYTPTWPEVGAVLLTGLLCFVVLVVYSRWFGLRTYAKLSSYDFAVVLVVGSIVASTILLRKPDPVRGLAAVTLLFGLQYVLSYLKRHTRWLRGIDKRPLLLMDGPRILYRNLDRARVTEADLMSVLRRHGVLRLAQVRAVVFETSGDISVLQSDDPAATVAPELLAHVRAGAADATGAGTPPVA